MKNFKVEAEGAEFDFVTMHVREVRLFQVYVQHEGATHRFHMQKNEDGDFKIMDKDHCPEQYHIAEELLSKAIKIYGGEERKPTAV
jgi:hypothetical protein